MRKVKIKLWDIADIETISKVKPPVTIEYWFIEDVSTEDFKEVAREKFEKVLEIWEKENER